MVTNFKFSDKEKQNVFEIAFALMEDIGYEKLTIRKICEEANISIGKFYRLFNSKEDLLAFFYSDASLAYKHECEPNLIGKNIKEQLVDFYTWYASYVESYGLEFVKNFFASTNPVMNISIYNNEIINITDNLLIQAISDNVFSLQNSRTVREISCDLCVIVKGVIFEWCSRHGESSLEKSTNDLLVRCIDGVLDS